MKLWQIDNAVAEMCKDIERVVDRKEYCSMSEKDLIFEFLICILGSGVRYELSLAYAEEVQENLLNKGKQRHVNSLDQSVLIESVLNSPVYSSIYGKTYKCYRYPRRASIHIAESIYNINHKYGSFKAMLEMINSPSELRRELIYLCPGIGPKQSSHYIKNIGFADDFAILDRHILHYLRMVDDVEISQRHVGKIERYEEVERKFIDTVSKFNHAASIVDQSLWFIMRALGKGAYSWA